MLRNLAFTIVAALMLSTPTHAADYPTRPITLVVAFPPGGPSDVLARIVGKQLEHVLGQPFVIENRPGGAGNIAADYVARAKPDGYTLLLGNNGILATNGALFARLGYNAEKDFAPISMVGIQPNILVVNPNVPVHSVAELIALMKASKDPYQVGTPGLGTVNYLASVLFAQQAGVKVEQIRRKKRNEAPLQWSVPPHSSTAHTSRSSASRSPPVSASASDASRSSFTNRPRRTPRAADSRASPPNSRKPMRW